MATLLEVATRLQKLGNAEHLVFGVAGGVLWTACGLMIAMTSGENTGWSFLHEWLFLQGFPLISLGVFLLLSSSPSRLRKIATDLGCNAPEALSRSTSLTILVTVAGIGSASLIAMGFNGRGGVLLFLWVTTIGVCAIAAAVTLRTVQLFRLCARLDQYKLTVHFYSPADTPSLRRLAEHVALFGVVMTAGYAFAFAATLAGSWTATPKLVHSVQVFWPIIYVPLCLAALAYPHATIYRIVRQEKDRTASDLQRRIMEISAQSGSLTNEQVDLLNNLTDLVKKIEETPNYPKNIKIVSSLILTALVNIASLVVPKEALADALRRFVGL